MLVVAHAISPAVPAPHAPAAVAVGESVAAPRAVLASHASASGWTFDPRIAETPGQFTGCPDGQRNAEESECLAAVQEAARGQLHVRGIRVANEGAEGVIPFGCSYSLASQRAMFNSNPAGRGSNLYKLVCIQQSLWSFVQRLQAVIVELREHEALRPVLENMCEKLPDVPITLMHGTHNGDFARRAATGILCVQNLREVNAINLDARTYSKLLTNPSFWEAAGDREKTLVFQTDSGICGDGADIAQFLDYDYCGAPWTNGKVGNGGFSIRDTATMKRLLEKGGEQLVNEDYVFSAWCQADQACTLCPLDVGHRFATETVGTRPAWAFHNNITYGVPSLCPFDEQIHEMNQRAKPLGDAPDAASWRPQVSDSAFNA